MTQEKNVSELMSSCSDDGGLICAVFRAMHAVNLYFEARCDERGLSAAEGKVLGILGAAGELSPGDIAHLLGIKPSTLTSVLDRLVGRGLIQRARRPENRRSVVISLTESGGEMAGWAKNVIAEFEERVNNQTSALDSQGFYSVIDSIIRVNESVLTANNLTPAKRGSYDSQAVHSLSGVNAKPENE